MSFDHAWLYAPTFPKQEALAAKDTFRPSQLKRFESCPAAYELEFVRNYQQGWVGIESFMGTNVHAAMQWLYEGIKAGEELKGLQEVRDFYRDLWARTYSEETVRVCKLDANGNPAHPPEFYFDVGLDCIFYYYLDQYPFEGEEIIAIEEEMEFDLNGYTIQIHPDLITKPEGSDLLRVRDYKCSNNQPSKLKLQQSIQLPSYEIGFREKLSHTGPVELVWHFLRLDKQFTVTRSESQLEQAKEKVLAIIDDIEQAAELQHYPYRVSFTCEWCAFNSMCPAYIERKEAMAA